MSPPFHSGIRVILDYVPNHTSNESEWFIKSIERDPRYENYYVWADGVKGANNQSGPPNNWVHLLFINYKLQMRERYKEYDICVPFFHIEG